MRILTSNMTSNSSSLWQIEERIPTDPSFLCKYAIKVVNIILTIYLLVSVLELPFKTFKLKL